MIFDDLDDTPGSGCVLPLLAVGAMLTMFGLFLAAGRYEHNKVLRAKHAEWVEQQKLDTPNGVWERNMDQTGTHDQALPRGVREGYADRHGIERPER